MSDRLPDIHPYDLYAIQTRMSGDEFRSYEFDRDTDIVTIGEARYHVTCSVEPSEDGRKTFEDNFRKLIGRNHGKHPGNTDRRST